MLSLDLFCDTSKLFHQEQFSHKPVFFFLGKSLKDFIKSLLLEKFKMDSNDPKVLGKVHPSAVLEGMVYVDEHAEVGPHTYIQGPCYIGPGSEVRHAAFIRGDVYVGAKCVVGHTTEVKSSVFLDGAKAGHFAYIGDSILCRDVNLGAGTKLANLKLRGDEVYVKHPESQKLIASGLKKMGAILGDNAQTGCNAVLSPGSLLMKNTAVLPCEHFHGSLLSGIARSRK